MALIITPIPCLNDNYAYLLRCEARGVTAVVDPSEADPILKVLEAHQRPLNAILNTHHHWDHTGGNQGLLERFPHTSVYGHRSDEGRIPGQTQLLEDGDVITLGDHSATIRHVPGHTTGAIAYCFEGAVFTGDTLFAAGCGRLFEGTPEMMYHALNAILGRLPPDTRVYFGHEYTQSNIRFARTVDPDNPALQALSDQVDRARAQGEYTTPSTIGQELSTNPFMRVEDPGLLATLKSRHHCTPSSPVEALASIRRLKDAF